MVRPVRWKSAATGIALVLACGCNARALAPTADAGRDASSVSTPTTAMGDASARAGGASGASGASGLTSPGAGASPRCGRRRRVGDRRQHGEHGRRSPALPARGRGRAQPDGPHSRAAACVSGRHFLPRAAAAFISAGRRRGRPVHPLRQLRRGRREVQWRSARTGAPLPWDRGRPRAPDPVELEQVFAVLASPRTMIDLVAYEPHGRGVLTLARAQREVTLWRVSTGRRSGARRCRDRRTTTRPAAASPSPPTVSPPSFPRLRHVLARRREGRGARARRRLGRRPRRGLRLGRPAHRRRGAVAAAHCSPTQRRHGHGPRRRHTGRGRAGGRLGTTAIPGAGAACRRSAPHRSTISYWCAEASTSHPACTRSGSATAARCRRPAVTTLPSAFMPDGASVVATDGGALERVRLADGVACRSRCWVPPGPWACRRRRHGGVRRQRRRGCCASRRARRRSRDRLRADDPSGNDVGPPAASSPSLRPGRESALSFDGQVLALAAPAIRVIRRADGALVTRIPARPHGQSNPCGCRCRSPGSWSTQSQDRPRIEGLRMSTARARRELR